MPKLPAPRAPLKARLVPANLVNKFSLRPQQMFAALRSRDYRIYQAGQLTSLCGTWMQQAALSWVVYQLTGSALASGLTVFSANIPLLFLTYVGGMAADRFNTRKVLIGTQVLKLLQAVALAGLAFVHLLSVPVIIVLEVLLGIFTSFETPARQALVPELVADDDLLNAVSLNSAAYNMSRMVGPLLAALCLGLFGAFVCFAANALSYMAAVLTLSVLKINSRRSRSNRLAEGANSKASSKADQPGVVKTIWSDTLLRQILLSTAAISLFGFQYMTLLPAITRQLLHGGSSLFGALSAVTAVGALVGSLVLASRGKRAVLKRVIGVSTAGVGVTVMLLAVPHVVALSFLAVFGAGLFLAFQISACKSIIQTSVAVEMRGRTNGLYLTVQGGLLPFGALAAGWSAETLGIAATLGIAGVALLAASAYYAVKI